MFPAGPPGLLTREDFHIHADGPQWPAAQLVDAQLDQILLRAEQGCRRDTRGPGRQGFLVARRIGVVVGKLAKAGQR